MCFAEVFFFFLINYFTLEVWIELFQVTWKTLSVFEVGSPHPQTPQVHLSEQYHLTLTWGIGRPPHSRGLVPQAKPGRVPGASFSLWYPVWFDYWGLFWEPCIQMLTHLYPYVSAKFHPAPLRFPEILSFSHSSFQGGLWELRHVRIWRHLWPFSLCLQKLQQEVSAKKELEEHTCQIWLGHFLCNVQGST